MAGRNNSSTRSTDQTEFDRFDEFEGLDEDTLRPGLDEAEDAIEAIEDRLEGLLDLGEPDGAAAANDLPESGERSGDPVRRSARGTPKAGPKLADSERRGKGPDRRKSVIDTRTSGLERRRGPGRRLPDFVKSAEEGEMNAEQFLFLKAIETFKAANNKHYPNWTDVLEVVRLLGYRKVQPSELNLPGADDWHERADAASAVRDREGIAHPRRKAG
ncbi:MAG: hypothetical protein AAGF47_01785 [Planctomycetota bacterium]